MGAQSLYTMGYGIAGAGDTIKDQLEGSNSYLKYMNKLK
jgi:hypothetical protein